MLPAHRPQAPLERFGQSLRARGRSLWVANSQYEGIRLRVAALPALVVMLFSPPRHFSR